MKKLIIPLITLSLTTLSHALGRNSFGSDKTTPSATSALGIQGKYRNTYTNNTVKTEAPATQSPPAVESHEILKYADSGVGSPYVWGGSKWSTTNRKIYGADCSGFTQKAWGYPSRISVEQSLPSNKRLSTAEFIKAQDAGYPWKRLDGIAHSKSQPGDAMVYRSNGKGHIFLVSKTDNSGVVTLEARGKKYGIGYARKSYAYLKNKGYKTIRKTD